MTYDMVRYQEEALSTESPITPDTEKMLVRVWEVVGEHLVEMATTGQQMDRVKRTVYYGKIDGELIDELMPSHPTGEKRERIVQMARVMHAVIGLITEIGEICEDVTKYIEEGSELNTANLKIENGDLLWYINLFLSCLRSNIVLTAGENILKLKTRYPNKFTQYDAINRDHAKEQAALTGSAADPAIDEDFKKLMQLGRRFRGTPIVDEDFNIIKIDFDTHLNACLDKHGLQ